MSQFRALVLREAGEGKVEARVEALPEEALPAPALPARPRRGPRGHRGAVRVAALQARRQGGPHRLAGYDLGRGKVFDTSLPLGPWVVTADEIADPQALHLSTRINGELRQSSGTDDMIWTCAEIIRFFSANLTLRPGMVIITGTPAGTAWSSDRELGGTWHPAPGLVAATRYCEPGDVVESEITRIGVLRNPVVAA